MTFLSSTFDLTSHAAKQEEALAVGLLLQQQLATRISVLALHTEKHPELNEDFFQLVRDLLTVLFCAENEILSEEGLDAMDSFRNEPGVGRARRTVGSATTSFCAGTDQLRPAATRVQGTWRPCHVGVAA